MADVPTLVSTAAAALSALFAGWQILQARAESRARTTLEQLQAIEPRVQALRTLDLTTLQDEAIAAYTGEGEMSEGVQRYLSLLDALEMLALARAKGIADRDLADEYLRTLVRDELVAADTLARLQEAWHDPTVYARLSTLIREFRGGAGEPPRIT